MVDLIHQNIDLMRFNKAQVVAAALDGPTRSSPATKSEFIEAIKKLQKSPFAYQGQGIHAEYDNPAMVEFWNRYKVVRSDLTDKGQHIVPMDARAEYSDLIARGLSKIERHDPAAFDMVSEVLGTVGVANIPDNDGGSFSAAIGYVYLSPKSYWSDEYCGEMLVHESTHNALFLIDMVQGLFLDIPVLQEPMAHAVSAIRNTSRPFDKSFHSAVVGATLVHYNTTTGNLERANKLKAPLQRTLEELIIADDRCREAGRPVTTDAGRAIIDNVADACALSTRRYHALRPSVKSASLG